MIYLIMDSEIKASQMFANDNQWNEEAAKMLGRFIALTRFAKKHAAHSSVIALSPDFLRIFPK